MDILSMGSTNGMIKECVEHQHDCCEMIITTGGEGITEINGRSYNTERGSVIVIPPKLKHLHYSESGFSDMYMQFEKNGTASDKTIYFCDKSGMIEQLGNMLFMVYLQKETNYKNICNSIFNTIWCFVEKFSNENTIFEFVRELKNIIAMNFGNTDFLICSAAKQLGVSYDYLRHCFKTEMGITPLEYLTELRISQAKNYLEDNRAYSITRISSMCGFSDQYYFSRCFKKHTGISPREYRKKHLLG